MKTSSTKCHLALGRRYLVLRPRSEAAFAAIANGTAAECSFCSLPPATFPRFETNGSSRFRSDRANAFLAMKSKIASFTRTLCASSLTAAALLGGGCASIIHGGPRTITVATKPAGATATIAKEEGETVSVNTTPFTIALEPKKAYFKGQTYKIKLELPGYASTEVFVRPEVSGWYFANLIFGGLIGMLIVDPATGSMYNLTPDKIDQQLSKSQVELIKNGNGFVVVMVSQTTPAERANMVKIN